MSADLRSALSSRVVIGDGAMGTMLQAHDLTLTDFEQLEGCNEVLNRTRPDIVRAIHDAYFDVGVDAVETNTFGTNLSALGEYGIADQILPLAEAAARIARWPVAQLGPIGAMPGRSSAVRAAPISGPSSMVPVVSTVT